MNKNNRTPQPAMSIEDFMRDQIRRISSAFTVPMKVTVIVRKDGDPDAELVFTADDIDAVIETMQRRRDGVVESQIRPR